MHIILSILVLLLMILVHEWGHFIAGRICHVSINEFSIGFGPKIFSKKGKKETTYSIRAFPLGGYCAFDADDPTGAIDTSLNKQPLLNRLFIFIAGPLMNMISCAVILFVICFFVGNPTPVTVIESTQPGYEAAEVLEPGDEILKANGIELHKNPKILSEVIQSSKGSTMTFEIKRGSETLEVKVTPKFIEEKNAYAIGIIQARENVTIGFMESIKLTGATMSRYATAIFDTIGGLFTGKYSVNDMSSIVGIVSVMSEYASPSNIDMFLSLCAYISFNLGLMNLLPIPGLDGSKILFGLIEGVTRKKIPEKVEVILTLISLAFLLILTGYLMLHDVFILMK